MPIELTILSMLVLISINYWLWVFSKKEFTIVTQAPTVVHKGNVEMVKPHNEMLENSYNEKMNSRSKRTAVPLPDPAALMKKAPKTSFGSRAKSDE